MSFQDILGQLPLLKSYTHILLCFSLPDDQRESVLDGLLCATKHLLAAYPFLAGTVVHKGAAPGNSGTFSVDFDRETGNSTFNVNELFHIKDLSQTLPPYAAIQDAQAPPSMLPVTMVAPPRPAFPKTYAEERAPVLEMQVSLLQGGLLLDIAAQHNIIDATGIFYIAHLLSRLMADQPNLIPKADLVLGNCDRINIISLLPPDEPLPKEMSEFIQPYPQTVDRDTLAQFRWYFFHMSPEAIAAIHTEAISHPEDFVASLTTVSVNDALTAFFWQRLTRVRSRLSPSSPTSGQYSEPTTQLTRAADLRRTMKLSPAYMGHMVRTANLRLPVSTVATSSLSYLASALRNCVSEHTTPQAVRSYATLLARTTDKSRILYAGGFNPLTDLSCSSMAHVMVPRFGKGLGVPEFVRRPAAGLLPSGMYFGPGRGGEGVDAMVCLKSSEIEGLMGDEVWSSKIEVVGGNC